MYVSSESTESPASGIATVKEPMSVHVTSGESCEVMCAGISMLLLGKTVSAQPLFLKIYEYFQL
jgi:hypothetical protein